MFEKVNGKYIDINMNYYDQNFININIILPKMKLLISDFLTIDINPITIPLYLSFNLPMSNYGDNGYVPDISGMVPPASNCAFANNSNCNTYNLTPPPSLNDNNKTNYAKYYGLSTTGLDENAYYSDNISSDKLNNLNGKGQKYQPWASSLPNRETLGKYVSNNFGSGSKPQALFKFEEYIKNFDIKIVPNSDLQTEYIVKQIRENIKFSNPMNVAPSKTVFVTVIINLLLFLLSILGGQDLLKIFGIDQTIIPGVFIETTSKTSSVSSNIQNLANTLDTMFSSIFPLTYAEINSPFAIVEPQLKSTLKTLLNNISLESISKLYK
jgi:hypothetical protein